MTKDELRRRVRIHPALPATAEGARADDLPLMETSRVLKVHMRAVETALSSKDFVSDVAKRLSGRSSVRHTLEWAAHNYSSQEDNCLRVFSEVLRVGRLLYESGLLATGERQGDSIRESNDKSRDLEGQRAQGLAIMAAALFTRFTLDRRFVDLDGESHDFLFGLRGDLPNEMLQMRPIDYLVDPARDFADMFPEWLSQLRREGIAKYLEGMASRLDR
jgi:hypothetical protein